MLHAVYWSSTFDYSRLQVSSKFMPAVSIKSQHRAQKSKKTAITHHILHKSAQHNCLPVYRLVDYDSLCQASSSLLEMTMRRPPHTGILHPTSIQISPILGMEVPNTCTLKRHDFSVCLSSAIIFGARTPYNSRLLTPRHHNSLRHSRVPYMHAARVTKTLLATSKI